jgi:sodium-dependent dicarboxylate transporter 2/3/5
MNALNLTINHRVLTPINECILAGFGGVSTLLVGVAIGSSLGMVLPISTPPNAIAASTGMIEQKDMVKTGLIMGVVGLVLGYGMLIVLGASGFFA